MKYITLDTCIWLGLIKIGLHDDNNVFEEICFWIENKHIIHITPENMIREWERNKVKKTIEIINDTKTLNKNAIGAFKDNANLSSAYKPDVVQEIITNRIARVDVILKTHSEFAPENQTIYEEAIKRNFDCIAPNHTEDSFRDTINIFTLINYIKSKGYYECCFSTINYADFSEGKSKKHDLHSQLVDDFKNANLEYFYCDEEPFGNKLINIGLRKVLPRFQDYLKDKKDKEEAKALAAKKVVPASVIAIPSPDGDYLENIKYIDMILVRKTPTAFEQDLIKLLIGRHCSYKQYFLNNIGNNGLV